MGDRKVWGGVGRIREASERIGTCIPLVRPPRPKHPLPEPSMLAKIDLDSRLCWARGQAPTSENPPFFWGVRNVSFSAGSVLKIGVKPENVVGWI